VPAAKPERIGAFGATGSGKTAWVKQQLQADTRLFVWDFKHDPSLKDLGTPYTNLGAAIRAMAAPTFRIRYLVDHDADRIPLFDLACTACYQVGKLRMFVDELPEVTRASGSLSAAWRKCINVGRDYEVGGRRLWLAIIATAQRLAEVDHSFLSNLDVIHSGRLGLRDAKRLEAMHGIPAADLVQLADLQWIEWRQGRPGVTRGALSFGNKKTVEVKKRLPTRRTP
jgi:hypothetical protein